MALSYSNECSDATPVSTSDCACDEQDGGNEILPSFTEGVARGSCFMVLRKPNNRRDKDEYQTKKPSCTRIRHYLPDHGDTMRFGDRILKIATRHQNYHRPIYDESLNNRARLSMSAALVSPIT